MIRFCHICLLYVSDEFILKKACKRPTLTGPSEPPHSLCGSPGPQDLSCLHTQLPCPSHLPRRLSLTTCPPLPVSHLSPATWSLPPRPHRSPTSCPPLLVPTFQTHVWLPGPISDAPFPTRSPLACMPAADFTSR